MSEQISPILVERALANAPNNEQASRRSRVSTEPTNWSSEPRLSDRAEAARETVRTVSLPDEKMTLNKPTASELASIVHNSDSFDVLVPEARDGMAELVSQPEVVAAINSIKPITQREIAKLAPDGDLVSRIEAMQELIVNGPAPIQDDLRSYVSTLYSVGGESKNDAQLEEEIANFVNTPAEELVAQINDEYSSTSVTEAFDGPFDITGLDFHEDDSEEFETVLPDLPDASDAPPLGIPFTEDALR